jgi:Fe-S-cluster containining protein
MRSLLPALQATADAFVSHAAGQSVAAGKPISCTAGCGACCRQLVPIAPSEARQVAALVEDLPEPRRTEVKARFAEARRRLEDAKLLRPLEETASWSAAERVEKGLAYFRLGVPCPFLENESCSIYENRPIACREYLVTSPPEFCAAPTPDSVDTVPLPTRVWAAVAWEEAGGGDFRAVTWVPLILAPDWSAANRDAETLHPGPELLRDVYARFARDRSGGGAGT